MRAERKLGLLLETTDRAKAGDNQWSFDGLTTTLNDLLVASNPTRFQMEASLPEDDFEQHIAGTKERGDYFAFIGMTSSTMYWTLYG